MSTGGFQQVKMFTGKSATKALFLLVLFFALFLRYLREERLEIQVYSSLPSKRTACDKDGNSLAGYRWLGSAFVCLSPLLDGHCEGHVR